MGQDPGQLPNSSALVEGILWARPRVSTYLSDHGDPLRYMSLSELWVKTPRFREIR